jgi:hypothetical protein
MKIVFINSADTISLIPRSTIANTNTLELYLTSEGDNVKGNYIFSVNSYMNGILRINTVSFSSLLKLGQTYKIELLDGVKLVYLGRLIVVDQNTDIQNYSRSLQSNSLFK